MMHLWCRDVMLKHERCHHYVVSDVAPEVQAMVFEESADGTIPYFNFPL